MNLQADNALKIKLIQSVLSMHFLLHHCCCIGMFISSYLVTKRTDLGFVNKQKCEICCSSGVFGESVSVMEGDSVTLNTGVTEIRFDDDILWTFGAEKSLIAKIKKNKQIFSTYDGPDGRFRDRLKLDNQTGSLSITNITTEHAGLYKLEIFGAKWSSKILSVSVYGE